MDRKGGCMAASSAGAFGFLRSLKGRERESARAYLNTERECEQTGRVDDQIKSKREVGKENAAGWAPPPTSGLPKEQNETKSPRC